MCLSHTGDYLHCYGAETEQNKAIFQTPPLFVSQAGLVKGFSMNSALCVTRGGRFSSLTSPLNQKVGNKSCSVPRCNSFGKCTRGFRGHGEENAGWCYLPPGVPREFSYKPPSPARPPHPPTQVSKSRPNLTPIF